MLKNKMMEWRSRHITRWNRHCTQIMRRILPKYFCSQTYLKRNFKIYVENQCLGDHIQFKFNICMHLAQKIKSEILCERIKKLLFLETLQGMFIHYIMFPACIVDATFSIRNHFVENISIWSEGFLDSLHRLYYFENYQ